MRRQGREAPSFTASTRGVSSLASEVRGGYLRIIAGTEIDQTGVNQVRLQGSWREAGVTLRLARGKRHDG